MKPADAPKAVEAAKPADAPLPEAAKPEPAKSDATKPDAAKPDAGKPAADDPFADPPAAGKQAAAEEPAMRAWTDDTGEYEIHGKLVKIMPTKVRILKDTGKYTTVPMDRLSQTDFQYVQQQLAAAHPGLVGQTGQENSFSHG